MLTHQKIVLQAVSDNTYLFRKELIKSMLWLNEHDQYKLKIWVRAKYLEQHKEIIDEVLYKEKYRSDELLHIISLRRAFENL